MHRTQFPCTVCGKLNDAPWPLTVEWEGESYGFCSEACREEFVLDPEEYLHDLEEEES